MYGGIKGFEKHGETFHPDYYLNPKQCEFHKTNYICSLDGKPYFSRKHMARAIHKLGWSDEAYYMLFGEEYMPNEWRENTTDPKYGDARNRPECLQCGERKCSFSMWSFSAFCCFSCATKWASDNTDFVETRLATNKKRLAENPDHQLRPNQLRYWIVKGYSDEDAKILQRIRQQTFTKEKCIAKHGEEIGLEVWKQRQVNWQYEFNNKPDAVMADINLRKYNGNTQSAIALTLFDDVSTVVPDLKYGKANEYHILRENKRGYYHLDCLNPVNNRVVEFFGDYWHANPRKYTANDILYRDFTAQQIWDEDKARYEFLTQSGFIVKVVWESDYRKNGSAVALEVAKFLKGEDIQGILDQAKLD
jgi:G:T-mismatch repair DNA endonuclease (very short patch repair protein)